MAVPCKKYLCSVKLNFIHKTGRAAYVLESYKYEWNNCKWTWFAHCKLTCKYKGPSWWPCAHQSSQQVRCLYHGVRDLPYSDSLNVLVQLSICPLLDFEYLEQRDWAMGITQSLLIQLSNDCFCNVEWIYSESFLLLRLPADSGLPRGIVCKTEQQTPMY